MQKIQRIHFDTLDSTISWIKAHYLEFNPDEIISVTAAVQTAGKGRFSRPWVSQRGNLHLSLFYYLKKSDPRIPHLAQLMAFAISSLLDVKIKWPNDLVICEKKLGGILVEVLDCKEKVGIIQSLGLNVNTPVAADQPTISLKEWKGTVQNLEEIRESILSSFFTQLEKGFSKDLFNQKLVKRGEVVRVDTGNKSIEGTLIGVEESGKLVLRKKEGTLVEVSSGDLY